MNAPTLRGCPVIGYVQIDDVLIRRADLEGVIDDVGRFERCRPDAEAASRYIEEHGSPCGLLDGWSEARVKDTLDTVADLGVVHEAIANGLRAVVEARHAGP